jgi:peptidoglycan/xylan/chitin deacetylase (PgdA/CDA1 family)
MSAGRRARAAALVGKRSFARLTRPVARWRGVVALNYHRVGDRRGQPWDRTLWNADAEELDEQLGAIASEADVIGPQELLSLSRERRPGRYILLTFDDGYRDNYLTAYPLLRRHGLTATFFPCAGFLDDARVAWWDEIAWMVRNARRESIVLPDELRAGGEPAKTLPLGPEEEATIAALVAVYKKQEMAQAERLLEFVAEASGSGRCDAATASELWMSWDMAREMRAAGMSFGGHTVTHPILAHLSPELQQQEIVGCASRLQAELAEPMRWFAYPVGARDTFTADTRRLLSDAGVELAFSFYGGFARFAQWDPFDVPRVHVSPEHGPELLRATMMLPQLFARW